jgi:glycosyltransferase involved in cell wall biosynthesis
MSNILYGTLVSKRSPRVSVIIPAHNAADYIRETLDSVLSQTFDDLEIIVINDGSPDEARLEQELAPFLPHIIYIKQGNQGVSCARNAGIRIARGIYLAMVDADDVWKPNYLEVQTGFLDRNPQAVLVYPNAEIFGDGPGAGEDFMARSPSDGDVTFESLISLKCNVMVSVTARKDAIVRVGMFDEKLRSCEDFDLWLRLARSGGIILYHREKLVRYRRHPGSLSSDPVWMCEHALKVFDKLELMGDLSESERSLVKDQRKLFQARKSLTEGKRALGAGDVDTAVDLIAEANRFYNKRKLGVALFFIRHAPRLTRQFQRFRERNELARQT